MQKDREKLRNFISKKKKEKKKRKNVKKAKKAKKFRKVPQQVKFASAITG